MQKNNLLSLGSIGSYAFRGETRLEALTEIRENGPKRGRGVLGNKRRHFVRCCPKPCLISMALQSVFANDLHFGKKNVDCNQSQDDERLSMLLHPL